MSMKNRKPQKENLKYAVMALKQTLAVEVMGVQTEMELKHAPGMIGMMPVFETEEQARAQYPGRSIMEIQIFPEE